MKLGIIGFGNMAQAITDGLLAQKTVEADSIYVCARNWDKLQKNAEKRGVHPCRDAAEVAEAADLVIVAVKPYQVADVLAPVKEILHDKIVFSIAAGMTFDKYEEILLPGTAHMSTVPNTPVKIGEGIFVCEDRHSLSDAQMDEVKKIFSTVGLMEFVESEKMSVAGTVAGCGPAFAAMFIEALGDAGVKHGLSRDTAYRLASQMVAGTGKLQVTTGEHPGAMKDAVCSPGGTTIVGVTTLEEKGFRGAVTAAIDAIEKK